MIQTFDAMRFVTANRMPPQGRPIRRQLNPSQRRFVGALMIVVLGLSIGFQVPFAADACVRELPPEINAAGGRSPAESLALGVESGETELPTLANVIQSAVEGVVCNLSRLARLHPLLAMNAKHSPA
jgi:hypothetical protein